MGVNVKVNFDKRKLEAAIKERATESLQSQTFNVECPHCQNNFDAHSGQNTCPHCLNTVNLNLNIKF